MTTCLGKSCSFSLPRVPFVNCCQFMYLVISLLVLRAGCGILLYQFLIIAHRFTLYISKFMTEHIKSYIKDHTTYSSILNYSNYIKLWQTKCCVTMPDCTEMNYGLI